MSLHLTAGQKALLQAALVERQHQLDHRLTDHLQGMSRAEHARDVLQQDADDEPQREAEREVDMALADQEVRELGLVSQALLRLPSHDFGVCTDCEKGIPFDRLKAEPWALRCVSCQAALERRPYP